MTHYRNIARHTRIPNPKISCASSTAIQCHWPLVSLTKSGLDLGVATCIPNLRMVTWLDSIFQVVLLQLFQHVQYLNCIKFFSTSIFRLINFSAMPNDVDRYGRQRERRVRSPSHCSGRSRSQSRRSRSRRSHSRRSRSSSRSRSRRSSYTRRSRKSRSSRSRSPRLKEYVLKVRRLDKQNEEIKVNDEESDSDRDDLGDISRSRRLMKVDVNNPLSAFEVKTKTKLAHIQASSFCKQTWNEIRGMDGKTGNF